MRAAIATCTDLPELDEDGPSLVEALSSHGIEAVPAVWDDPGIDWNAFDAVVLRSTWDYAGKWRAFLSWIDDVGTRTRLLNPAHVVRWNIDKRYLRELSGAGVPIVPTLWLERASEALSLDAYNGQGEVVIKPVVSAGSKDTGRFTKEQEPVARELIQTILASGRPVMAQPYMASVDHAGETALLYFRGVYSHAIRKGPLLAVGDGLEPGLFRREVIDPREAEADELAIGQAVLRALPFPAERLAYTRVDVVRDEQGAPRVIEVEFIEPSLFLQHGDGAAERFALAIASQLRS